MSIPYAINANDPPTALAPCDSAPQFTPLPSRDWRCYLVRVEDRDVPLSRSDKLTDLLADFAHKLVGEELRIQDILDHLVERIVDVLPVTGAGVKLMASPVDVRFVASSNATVAEVEEAQTEFAEGPCVEAYRSGEVVAVLDACVDERFPRFCARACRAGLAAVFAFPLTLHGKRIGVLGLYRDVPGELSASDTKSAQILADVAAAYIHNAQGRADAVNTMDQLRERSLHDPLTGLANRVLLKERLEHAVARAIRSHQVVAVLFVDLDHFKAVNDTFGHDVGDKLLQAVADRLNKIVRASDTLARLSGDEFVFLCEDLETAESARGVAERVVSALEPVFDFDDLQLQVSASVGLAFAGPGDQMPESLLRDADFAMYQAKQAGGAQHQVLDIGSRLAAEQRGVIARELREALDRSEFHLVYQPVVEVKNGHMLGVEALLRWQHPTRGCIAPKEFLPTAEQTGIIEQLGEWVLTQACRDLKRWHSTYGQALIDHVTVNVSPHQVMAPGLDVTVKRALEATGVNPAQVFLEVTENAFLEDGTRAGSVLEQIRMLGVGLVLDDFGTGFSSLNYLRRFPFDVLKIDRTFIGGLASRDGTREIVAAVIDLAHALELLVVAEGIETQQQLSAIADLGADNAQGFYLCRPLSADHFEQRILQPAGTAPIRLPLGHGQA